MHAASSITSAGRTQWHSPDPPTPRQRCVLTRTSSARASISIAEADSLNASILGEDAVPGTPEFDLYVKQLVTEMTVKAGQKCTAIRRALVPVSLVDAVVDAASERLNKVVVGHPDADGVTMGALASIEQRDEVLKSIRGLTKSATIVFGDPDNVDVVGADGQSGAFLSPVLLRAEENAHEVHELEAFGPVSTVIGYDGIDHAIELAARGEGSLVASVVTADTDIARRLVLGLAAFHGRVLVLNRDDAKESTGHGSPFQSSYTAVPAVAGGGEELGGIRGVLHHMQRTAVQGTPDVLTAVGERWFTGSQRTTGSEHPFRKSLAELKIGDTVVGGPRQVTLADIDHLQSSPVTPSTLTPIRWPLRRIHSSAASSRTAILLSHSLRACSSTRLPARFSRTSAWTASGS